MKCTGCHISQCTATLCAAGLRGVTDALYPPTCDSKAAGSVLSSSHVCQTRLLIPPASEHVLPCRALLLL